MAAANSKGLAVELALDHMGLGAVQAVDSVEVEAGAGSSSASRAQVEAGMVTTAAAKDIGCLAAAKIAAQDAAVEE